MSTIGFAARPCHGGRPDVVDPNDQIGQERADDAGRLGLEPVGPDRIGVGDAVIATATTGLARLRAGAVEAGEQHERVEQGLLGRVVRGGLLRVPLHADDPRLDRRVDGGPHVELDRFDEAVGAAARHPQPVADPLDALVMMRRAREVARLRDGGEIRRRFRGHRVAPLGALERHAVLEQLRPVRQVLIQRAAVGDVHHLHAATDAQHWDPDAFGGQQEVGLEGIAIGLDPVVVLHVRHGSVPGGVDVTAADEEEPVEGFEDLLGGAELARRDDRGAGPRTSERIDVRARHSVAAIGPAGDSVIGEVVRDDGDEWAIGAVDARATRLHADAASPANRVNTSRPLVSC